MGHVVELNRANKNDPGYHASFVRSLIAQRPCNAGRSDYHIVRGSFSPRQCRVCGRVFNGERDFNEHTRTLVNSLSAAPPHSNAWNLAYGIGCKTCGDEDQHDGEGCPKQREGAA